MTAGCKVERSDTVLVSRGEVITVHLKEERNGESVIVKKGRTDSSSW
jgi:hypothetical protein